MLSQYLTPFTLAEFEPLGPLASIPQKSGSFASKGLREFQLVPIDLMSVAGFGNHIASVGLQERRPISDLQLRAALDTIPGLAWLAGVDGSAEYLNRRWLEYTGLSQTQAVGWGWTAAIYPADVNQLTVVWRRV